MNHTITESDLAFLSSWLKSEQLILAGLQILELGDPQNAEAVRHEREMTETAFRLLPDLIRQAKEALGRSSDHQ